MFILGGFFLGLMILFALDGNWPASMAMAICALIILDTAFIYRERTK